MTNGTILIWSSLPFLDSDVPRRASYGVYISQLVRFARAPSHVSGFYCCKKAIIAKLLKQGYRYHKHGTAFFFSKFYRRSYKLILNYISVKKFLQQNFHF